VWLYRSTREWQSPPHRVQQKAVGCWDCCCSSALLHGGSGSWFVCELCRPTLPDDECPSMQLYSWWTISYIINTLSLLFASLPSPIPVSRVSWLRSPVLSLHRAGPVCSALHQLMFYWSMIIKVTIMNTSSIIQLSCGLTSTLSTLLECNWWWCISSQKRRALLHTNVMCVMCAL
jgi:hypothetical protein